MKQATQFALATAIVAGLVSLAAAKESPKPTAVAGAPAPIAAKTAKVVVNKPAEYRIFPLLSGCLKKQEGVEQTECLRKAAPVLQQALYYQSCLWGVVPKHSKYQNLDCQSPDSGSFAVVDLSPGRIAVLERAQAVVEKMEAGKLTDPAQAFRKLLADGDGVATAGRGGYSLISQGGVSLGAWQGGFTYYATEVLKERRRIMVAKGLVDEKSAAIGTSTGASAGAVNAFIAGTSGCAVPSWEQESPETNNLFYEVWVNTLGLYGTDGPGLLADEETCSPPADSGLAKLGLFCADPLTRALRKAEKYVTSLTPVHEDCSYSLGFVATHLDSIRTSVHVDDRGKSVVSAPRLTERFAVKVTLKKKATPDVENLNIPDQGPLEFPTRLPEQTFYARLGSGSSVGLEELLPAIRASGAFPVAFPPVNLTYQRWDPRRKTYKTFERQPFVDGGTLDNAPIRLASTMDRWTRKGQPNPSFEGLFQMPVNYLFVNPAVVSWEKHVDTSTGKTEEAARTMWKAYSGFLAELFETSTDMELSNTAEQLEFVRQARKELPRLSVPQRNMPITGDRLLHFAAFLNRDFRDFDFYIGMADAERHFQTELSDEDKAVFKKMRSAKLECISEYYDVALAGSTGKILERVEATEETLRGLIPACGALPKSHHAFLSLLAAMHNFKSWERSSKYKSEQDVPEFFAKVKAAGFVFAGGDAEIDSMLNTDPNLAFRSILQDTIDQVAAKHDGAVGTIVKVGGRAAADAYVSRSFPRVALAVGIPTMGLEVGGLWKFAQPSENLAFRFDFLRLRAFQLGTRTIRERESGRLEKAYGLTTSANAGLSLVVGLPWFFMSTPPGIADLEFGLGATYQQVWGIAADRSDLIRQNLGLTGALRFVFLQRLYLSAELSYFDFPLGKTWITRDYVGQQPDKQRDDLPLNFSMGLRFF